MRDDLQKTVFYSNFSYELRSRRNAFFCLYFIYMTIVEYLLVKKMTFLIEVPGINFRLFRPEKFSELSRSSLVFTNEIINDKNQS